MVKGDALLAELIHARIGRPRPRLVALAQLGEIGPRASKALADVRGDVILNLALVRRRRLPEHTLMNARNTGEGFIHPDHIGVARVVGRAIGVLFQFGHHLLSGEAVVGAEAVQGVSHRHLVLFGLHALSAGLQCRLGGQRRGDDALGRSRFNGAADTRANFSFWGFPLCSEVTRNDGKDGGGSTGRLGR